MVEELNPGSCEVDGCEYVAVCEHTDDDGITKNAVIEEPENGPAALYVYEHGVDVPGEVTTGKVRCKTATGAWTGWNVWTPTLAARVENSSEWGIAAKYCIGNSCEDVTCKPGDSCWTHASHP